MHATTTPVMTTTQKSTLATLLGPWAVIPEQDDSYDREYRLTMGYTGPEPLRAGAKLHLDTNRYRHQGKLHCHANGHIWDGTEHHYLGNFLSNTDRVKLQTSINIKADKSVEQIAKDLQRRLLPFYLDAYELGMAQLQNAHAKHARQREMASMLAAMLPDGRVRGGERISDESSVYTSGPTWRVSHYSLRIEGFSMSQEQAHMLATLLCSETWRAAQAL